MAEWGSPWQVAWNGAWLLVWSAALLALWREPRSTFGGLRPKVLWAIAIAFFGVSLGGYWLPIAALVFLIRLRAEDPIRGWARRRVGTGRT